MSPAQTGANYDQLAEWWRDNAPPAYGLDALKRALSFAPSTGHALDIGCGSQGRFIEKLLDLSFDVEGLDVSAEMIALARQRHPRAQFRIGDICDWLLPRQYELITAWDSTFHLPLHQQEPVLKKLCDGLSLGGVILFTCGGGARGEISGTFQGQEFEYSTLGVEKFVALLDQFGCWCRHVEYDQWPELHVCIIAQKK